MNIQTAAFIADPALDLCAVALAAEKAAEASLRQQEGDVADALIDAADAALCRAYATAPTSLAGIATLARLVLNVEDCDPEIADALRSIEAAALNLSRP